MKRMLEVAAAFIARRGLVLLSRRSGQDEVGGYWEFPGGGLEPGEDLPTCLARELREELAVEVSVGKEMASVVHDYGDFVVHLHLFRAHIVCGEPKPLGCAEVRWVPLSELSLYNLAPADRHLLERLRGLSDVR